MKKIKIFLFLLFLISCKKEEEITNINYFNKAIINKSIKKENIKLSIDTICPSSNLETSFNGSYTLVNDKIIFYDVYFGYLLCFDKNLNLLSKHFGRGKNSNELIGADYITYSTITDKYYVLSSKTGVIAVINSKFQKEKEFEINFNIKRSREEVINEPLAHLMDSYEIDYGYDALLNVFDENHIAIAITSSHPKFNGYFNSKYYYENSRVIALINIEDEYIDRLIGRRSPLFLKNQLPNYDHFNYQVVNDSIYLNF